MGRAVLYEDDHVRVIGSDGPGAVLVTMNDIGTVATGDGELIAENLRLL